MPDMDGLETATIIKPRPRSRDTPIIFVTGSSTGVAIGLTPTPRSGRCSAARAASTECELMLKAIVQLAHNLGIWAVAAKELTAALVTELTGLPAKG
jgi:CheY-like chemotaxis protein